MIGKIILKAVKIATVKTTVLDKEFNAIKNQVEELDTRANCIYFDRFTETIRGAS
tara:strand:- start:2373 stop:2537 length:165 start_codon:yes stop_codon:yes gene_type:complete